VFKTLIEFPAGLTEFSMATPAQTQPAGGAAAPATEACPSPAALVQAARLAIKEDRPIQLDYFSETTAGTAFIGEDPTTKERILVKSADEFTSLIQKIFKVGEDILITTENSLYIVSGKVQKKRINMAQLHGLDE
jgi:hypothetical protein